jgi:phenylalanyl-tRNA synthetase beta chain
MAAAQGFTEVHNYSFVSDEMALVFGLNPAHHVQVTNPIAADQGLLRASLLPGIWKNVNDNARHLESFRLFECGREIHRERESPHLAAAIYARSSGQENLLELKRLAECLLPGVEASGAKALPIEHPSRSAEIRYQGAAVGRLFEFHPRLVEAGRAAVLDLDLELVEQFVAERERPGALRSRPLRRFPASAFDLSVVAGARAAAAGVRDALAKLAGADLLEIAFLREFSLPGGSRSLSFRLTVGAPDRTLAAAEVGQIRARVVDGMKAAGYQFRE